MCVCVYLAQYATIPMQIGVLNILTLPIKKEWKCEKHSYTIKQATTTKRKSKLCYKISNVNNSIVSNGCFYERLNQIKSNLIDLLCVRMCVGIVQQHLNIICMKGYQIKLTENKMWPISDRFDWICNEFLFFFCIVSYMHSFFTRSIIKLNLFICKFIHKFRFAYWMFLAVVFFLFHFLKS